MSGHSKFANIKHKKEKNDAAKGKIFTRIGKELMIAVKEGGPDPNNNSKLRDVIAKAKANNMLMTLSTEVLRRQPETATQPTMWLLHTRAMVQAEQLLSLSALQTTRTEQQPM